MATEPLLTYPLKYDFKVIGKRTPSFIEGVTAHFTAVLGTPPTIQERESTQGAYVALNVQVTLANEEQRQEIYKRLHQDPLVTFYL